MYPTDLPPGYEENWVKIISLYPPIDVGTLASVVSTHNGYPMPMLHQREVRLNAEKGSIEIWERHTRPLQAPRPGDSGTVPIYATAGQMRGLG
jgi:hypothetical protein